ncbi:MAG: TSUP family transporter, partial [Desulfitobacterium hafniense]
MEMLSWELWLAMSGITFFATFIQVLTGFGFGLVAVPLLLFVLPSQQALLAGMILSMMGSSVQGFQMRRLVRRDLVLRLLLIGIPGLALGVVLSGYM